MSDMNGDGGSGTYNLPDEGLAGEWFACVD